MQAATQRKHSLTGVTIPAILIAIPAALFYGTLFSHLVDLPFYDDYNAVLLFLNQMVQAKSGASRVWLWLAGQHNEYKIFFVHALAWAQISMLGRVNFIQLCMLGDSAVLVLALVLWSTFLPDQKDLGKRLAYFVPVAWLLFQLGYWETLTWAMASLQNLWVIVFSFGTIRCLLLASRRAYAGALVLYALAIAASGNGFLLLPIGLLILGMRRQLLRAGGLLAVSVVCIAAYAYRYNVMSSQAPARGSVFSTLLHLRPGYALTFLGNAGAVAGSSPVSVAICTALGVILLLFFVWLVWRGYARRNPFASCCVLFILMTAVGVAGLRSDFGLLQSITPRYVIYGTLLMILAWTAIAEEFLQFREEPFLQNNPYLIVAMASIFLSIWLDGIGYKELVGRENNVVKWMAAFEHPGSPGSAEGPMPPLKEKSALTIAWRAQARGILIESIRLGVYEPPELRIEPEPRPAEEFVSPAGSGLRERMPQTGAGYGE
jgi:hypothetical protein